MITTETWWESIFSGPLAYGINKEKLQMLENEDFLYLSNFEDTDNHHINDQISQ